MRISSYWQIIIMSTLQVCPSLFLTVCVSFMGKFYQSLKDKNVEFTPASIERELLKACKEAKGKENRLVSGLRTGTWLLLIGWELYKKTTEGQIDWFGNINMVTLSSDKHFDSKEFLEVGPEWKLSSLNRTVVWLGHGTMEDFLMRSSSKSI